MLKNKNKDIVIFLIYNERYSSSSDLFVKKYRIYKNGEYIATRSLFSRNSKNITEAIRRDIYFEYKNCYTKYLYDIKCIRPFNWDPLIGKQTWKEYLEKSKKIKPTIITKLTTPHGSGYWYHFIVPKTIVNNNTIKLIRWLNFYKQINKNNI